jgi:DHA1 family bicyclomycin/chloramphenicol resistance-like MFS transporter
MNIVYLLMLSLINSCIELEISAPSFPDIMDHFAISETEVGLTISYNLVGFALASFVYGPLSDCFGRRRIMIFGNAILCLGALGCVFSPSISWLLVARFFQGIGAATSAVLASAIIADLYNPKKASGIYATMNTFFSAVMALSPILGGFINSAIGWRGNYGFVAVICIISWFLLFFFLPETRHEKQKLNIIKIIKDYKKLFSSMVFLGAAIVPSISYGCYMAFVAIAPFIYMQVFGESILVYTMHQAIIVFSYSFVSYFVKFITKKLGMVRAIYFSLFFYILGSVAIFFSWSAYTLTLFYCVFCVGAAVIYPIIFSHSVEIFPEIKGASSSLIMGLRYFVCSIITGAASFFYNDTVFSLSMVIFVVTCFIVWITIYLLSKIKFEEEI